MGATVTPLLDALALASLSVCVIGLARSLEGNARLAASMVAALLIVAAVNIANVRDVDQSVYLRGVKAQATIEAATSVAEEALALVTVQALETEAARAATAVAWPTERRPRRNRR